MTATTLQILYEGRTADTAIDDKEGFDTKFEDLFKDRSDEEILAIKKKYGATGDLLEAEQRIEAIAHRISSITTSITSCPTASRRRWCATRSSRPSATRNTSEQALAENGWIVRRLKPEPERELIEEASSSSRRWSSSPRTPPTSRLRSPPARKEAKQWNAVRELLQAVRLRRPG